MTDFGGNDSTVVDGNDLNELASSVISRNCAEGRHRVRPGLTHGRRWFRGGYHQFHHSYLLWTESGAAPRCSHIWVACHHRHTSVISSVDRWRNLTFWDCFFAPGCLPDHSLNRVKRELPCVHLVTLEFLLALKQQLPSSSLSTSSPPSSW